MADARFLFHVVIMHLIVLVAFAPVSWLRKGLFLVPAAIAAQWVIMGGCVVGNPDESGELDTTRLYRMFFPTMTTQASNDLTCLIHVLVTTVMAYRMSREC